MDLKTLLSEKDYPAADAAKFLAYVNDARAQESKPGKDGKQKSTPVTNNAPQNLYNLFVKFNNLGLVIDGVNVVITGKDMAMVTYHGYKNKVLQVYPESEIDLQLVRETDVFSVSKQSGEISYTHELKDPFGNKPIIGAYAVIKNKRGQFLELLNKEAYEEMKKASKQSYLWKTWESEFWLKSVVKRACKRHFNDIVAEIDKVDNEDFGIGDKQTPPEPSEDEELAIEGIESCETLDELQAFYMTLGTLLSSPRVIAAKDKRKAELSQ